MIPRVIPALLLQDGGLVKTVRFREPRYVGDPINTVRIFNDKQVDEIVLLDISAARTGARPDEIAIEEIVSEAFMPVGYGGGVKDLAQARRLIQLGVEKVILNTVAVERPRAIVEIADELGSSTTVVSIDVLRSRSGEYEVVVAGGTRATGIDVRRHIEEMARLGAGELLVTAIDHDGTMSGYDLELYRQVSGVADVPVIACGGAGSVQDMVDVVAAGAAAAAAGSLFVFHGRHRAVLINYPSYTVRAQAFASADSGGR